MLAGYKGTDPTSKFMGEISVILGNQVSLLVHYAVKEMKYTSQHYWDKTLEGKMSFSIANAVFRIVQNHGEKNCFRRFGGVDRPNITPWIGPYG